jgi:hypothetical protein
MNWNTKTDNRESEIVRSPCDFPFPIVAYLVL